MKKTPAQSANDGREANVRAAMPSPKKFSWKQSRKDNDLQKCCCEDCMRQRPERVALRKLRIRSMRVGRSKGILLSKYEWST